MPPARTRGQFQMKCLTRASTATSTCISFFLLSISLFSPSWTKVVPLETNETSRPTEVVCHTLACNQTSKESDLTKASRIFLILATATGFTAAVSLFVSCRCFRPCARLSNMLVSSVASLTTGTLGFTSTFLYMLDISLREPSLRRRTHITWSFWLAWLVFFHYYINSFLSLTVHKHSPFTGFGWHDNQIFLEVTIQRDSARDNRPVRSPDPPSQ